MSKFIFADLTFSEIWKGFVLDSDSLSTSLDNLPPFDLYQRKGINAKY